MLIAAGHSLGDILTNRQDGIPYAGWTLPQFGLWCDRAARQLSHQKADAIEAARMAIAACIDEKAAKAVAEVVRKLRAVGG